MTTRLRAAAARIGLPAWFIVIDFLWILRPETLGVDARHYQRAATAWLAGGDPWAVTEGGVPFAAGPHTLLFYAPTSLVPLTVAMAIWMVLGVAAAFWLVRRLEVPIWWFAFPPLLHSVWNGNPQSIALTLLVVGGAGGAIVAVGLKLYAAVALVLRPRRLILVSLVLLVTLPILPWQLYLADGAGVGSHLATAWNGSAWRYPILLVPTLLALWVLRHKGAEWYLVPAVWPATQFYYVAMAMPAVVRRPVAAAALALPVPLMAPAVVMGLAVLELRRSRVTAVQPANAGTQA
ncbi:MAG: hypothetical protein H0T59_11250 [Chloroflexi bacterium]|nr:hypothetical protein [Chloroflexota bacterium]